MLPVQKIEALVDENQNVAAHAALDEILALGPNNFAALKLRARLFRDSGRFLDESKVWQKIAVVDTTDEDYEKFLLSRRVDEREYIFFTQDIPTEGRRFLTLSKSVVKSALIGLMGSIVFLSFSHVAQVKTQFLTLFNLLLCFTVFVVVPWGWIIRSFLFTLRSITIGDTKIHFRNFLKTFTLERENCRSIDLTFDNKDRLLLIFSTVNGPSIAVDFREYFSPIRSRTFFLRDLQKLHYQVNISQISSPQAFKGLRFF